MRYIHDHAKLESSYAHCGHETTLTSRSEAAVREFYSKLNVEKEEK